MFNPFLQISPITAEKVVHENTRSLNNPSILSWMPANLVGLRLVKYCCERRAELFCKVMVSYRQNHFSVVSVNVQVSITKNNTNDVRKFGSWVWPEEVKPPRWIVEPIDPHTYRALA